MLKDSRRIKQLQRQEARLLEMQECNLSKRVVSRLFPKKIFLEFYLHYQLKWIKKIHPNKLKEEVVKYKIAWKEDETALYLDPYDRKYAAFNGNLAWRINNPGLIKHHCHFAKKNGSIGA